MPPKSSKSSKAKSKHLPPSGTSSKSQLKTVNLYAGEPSSSQPPSKKFKPLSALSRPPIFDLGDVRSQSQNSLKADVKGKGKAKAKAMETEPQDDRLWVDIYKPTTEADLAVHNRKVEDVRRWFMEAFEGGPQGKLRKYRRILVLRGPAGTAKTATVRVLAHELDLEILEWRNTIGEHFAREPYSDDSDEFTPSVEHEALMDKFETFIARASTCQSIFDLPGSFEPSRPTQSQSSTGTQTPKPKRQIILLEDLPNILHTKTQERFHVALHALVNTPTSIAPIVIIISDAGMRGEASDERMDQGGGGGRWGKDVVDVRSVVPSGLLNGPYVTQIGFNPIAPTLLRRALQSLVTTHFSSSSSTSRNTVAPSKEVVDIIIESSNGDIRSAIMALQFACVVELPGSSGKKGKKRSGGGGARTVLEAVTRREQSLALFHLMGKVLYNKRKGDPPNSSATAKDLQREKELDAHIKDPPPLPPFLKAHERRGSRVDVDSIYADSPIDSSLFSLYIHQNYTQFCDDMDHCYGVADWLSWVDSSGGETWYQANPHRFHLLALGTLHSLPCPVTRRSQKIYKPEFFEVLKKEREAEDGVRDVGSWLVNLATGSNEGGEKPGANGAAWRAGGWSRAEIATELGAVLGSREVAPNSTPPVTRSHVDAPPGTHRLFSKLVFTRTGATSSIQLGEGDDAGEVNVDYNELADDGLRTCRETTSVSGGWLENDDIEEF